MKLVVVHSPLLAATLGALMQRCGSRVRVVRADCADDALRIALRDRKCAGVFMDVGTQSHELPPALAELARHAVPVIAISSCASQLREALRRGAAGCLPSGLDENAILGALLVLFARDASEDRASLHHPAACAPAPRSTELTERQRAVLRHLCAGDANKDIGRELHISEKTVKTHVSAIFKALGVANRTQAAVAAREALLLEP